ncbi:DUF2971 domain-containing protein [Mycobacteroides chelonae]
MTAEEEGGPKTPDTLYHYTSAGGLLGIIGGRGGELCFHATDVLEMNDLSELSYGLGILRERVQELASEETSVNFYRQWLESTDRLLEFTEDALRVAPRASICAVSFTANPDLLSQWVTYGSGGGYAVGIPSATLAGASVQRRRTAGGAFGVVLAPIAYGRDQARARGAGFYANAIGPKLLVLMGAIGGAVEAFRRGMAAGEDSSGSRWTPADFFDALTIWAASNIKDEAFDAEAEWRLQVGKNYSEIGDLLAHTEPPELRESNGRLLPYRQVIVPVPNAESDGEVSKTITEVVVGPGAHQLQRMHAVQQLLIANGHDPAAVRCSTVPFRGW